MSAEFTNPGNAQISHLPLSRIDLHPSLVGVPGLTKRLLDLCFAIFGLVVAFPVMLVIAICIKLDSPGPVLFKQQRVGLKGRVFWMYKFRTMAVGAEQRQAELMKFNEMQGGVIFKMTNDPRVTRVGSWLRRTSLDELPQLVNVLRREMSLIGPRPLPTYEVEKHLPHQLRRLDVLPGCTGLWQVSGRSQLDSFQKMVDLDLEYIDQWFVGYDVRIILRTIFVVLKARGAC